MRRFTASRWHGYFPAITTPFTKAMRVDYPAFAVLAHWLVSEGMHGIVAAGTTGEWHALDFRERCRLFELTRDAVPAERIALAGCSALRPQDSLRYLEAACRLGMDGALLTVPPYVCPTQIESERFFVQMADQSPLPIVVYNWPQGTGVDLSPDTLQILARHENIIGIKNSTPDRNAFLLGLQRLAGQTNVYGIMPGEEGMALLQTVGGAGCIGAAGVLGRIQPGFFDALARGDAARAAVLGARDQLLMSTLFSGFRGRHAHAIPTLKYLLRLRGLPSGEVRPPLASIDAAQGEAISRLVADTGLLADA